jgi:hypothetical protein
MKGPGVRAILGVAIIAVMLASAAQASPPDTTKEFPDYSLYDLYQYHQSDSILLQSACGVTAGVYLGNSHFVYEFQRSLIPFFRFRGRGNKDRVASTALIMSLAIGIQGWGMAIAGCNDDQIEKTIIKVLAPFGSHIGYRPTPAVTFFAGIVPDVFLFTEDNGLLLQGRIGCRLDIQKAIVINVGLAKTALCGFKHAGGVFPIGVSVGVSLGPTKNGWAD